MTIYFKIAFSINRIYMFKSVILNTLYLAKSELLVIYIMVIKSSHLIKMVALYKESVSGTM